MHLFRIAATVLTALAFVQTAVAASTRFYLADQENFGTAHGFYLDFENTAADGTPCPLNTMKIIAGTGDGQSWRYIFGSPAWQLNHDYTAKVVISPSSTQLFLDGVSLGQSAGGFAPLAATLNTNLMPNWANGPATYLVIQSGLTVSGSSGSSANLSFDEEAARPPAMILFGAGAPQTSTWTPVSGETVTVTATFHIITAPTVAANAPFIDRYGQSIQSTWTGKVTGDAQLQAAIPDENSRLAAMGTPTGRDVYGGATTLRWNVPATGYFGLTKRNGFWWLVSPSGNPCFYVGIDNAPATISDYTPVTGRTNLFQELPPNSGSYAPVWGTNAWGEGGNTQYVSFHAANAIRKYGSTWATDTTNSAVARIKTFGFSGLGKWTDEIGGLPMIRVLGHGNVPNIVRHPDIFDPSIQTQLRSSLSAQIGSGKTDPLVVGWSIGNEYDEIITPDEVTGMLQKGASVPAKKALVDQALSAIYSGGVPAMATAWHVTAATVADLYAATAPQPPAADVETLRQFFARRYYSFLYQTVKSLDPNHLYFGFWIVPNWWVNESDWGLIAPYCDVIGYDRYDPSFADAALNRLIRATNKPILCGEFSYPPTYHMQRGFNYYQAAWSNDDADAGAEYTQWQNAAVTNPYCVGTCWFEYRDEPLTGRGPGQGGGLVYGEDYAFGIIDETDRVKWDLVTAMRASNVTAADARQAANAQFQPLALASRALRLAGGLASASSDDISSMDTAAVGTPAGEIDIADALALAQRGL